MAITFAEFQNLNEARDYPLADTATRLSTTGELLPNDILVDMHIYFPDVLGDTLFVSSVGVTNQLVTVTILATTTGSSSSSSSSSSSASGFNPVAVVRVLRSELVPYKNYAVEAQYPGVAGWVAFGGGAIRRTFSGLFDGPEQAMILPRLAHPYPLPPVLTLGSTTSPDELDGDVSIRVDGDLEISVEDRMIDGELKSALVFSMTDASLDDYTGPCGSRPDSRSCGRTIIETINGVTPDSNGNITINWVSPLTEGRDSTHSAIVVDFAMGLADSCFKPQELPDADGTLPNEKSDYCEAAPCIITDDFYRTVGNRDVLGDDWANVEGTVVLEHSVAGECAAKAYCPSSSSSSFSSSSSSSADPCWSVPIDPPPNYLDDFDDGIAHCFVPYGDDNWHTAHGKYRIFTSKETQSINEMVVTCLNKHVKAKASIELIDGQTGAQANAYIIFAWNPDVAVGTRYWFAGINVSEQRIEIGRVTAGGRIVENYIPMALDQDTEYQLDVYCTQLSSTTYWLQVTVTGATSQSVGIVASDDDFDPVNPVGLGVRYSWTSFDDFEVTT